MCRVLLLLIISACAVEPTPPPPPPDHGLIGTWRYVPVRADIAVDQRQVLVFGADGRYSMHDPRSAEAGTFEIAGNDVTISSSASSWITTGYAVTSDRLIVDALLPVGATDGLVGTWIGSQSSDQATSAIELELRADGTGHLVQTGSESDDVNATWVRDDPYAVITFEGRTRARSLPTLLGVAIGEWLYERVE
jgi:hypothetical protein